MLQAQGISGWRLDLATRQRRTVLFWRLNYLDKALGLILGRPLSIPRTTANETALPTLDQLLPSQSYSTSGTAVLFEAHYADQMHLLSRIMADAWHCLYGKDGDKVHSVKQSLDSWYSRATEVNHSSTINLGFQLMKF